MSVHWVVVVHLAVPLGMCGGNDCPYIGCASCFASCDAAAAASPPVWNQHAVTPAVHYHCTHYAGTPARVDAASKAHARSTSGCRLRVNKAIAALVRPAAIARQHVSCRREGCAWVVWCPAA